MQKACGVEMLRPSQLIVDREHRVQRPLDNRHVKNLADDFSPALFGQGDVSQRADGFYYILDSQHRCAAAILKGFGDHEFRFQVWRGCSIEDEANLFLRLNGKKRGNKALDAFEIGVEAKYPTNVGIVQMLQGYHLTVGAGRTDGVVSAVAALVRIYEGRVRGPRKGPAKPTLVRLPTGHLLSRTLNIITHAWQLSRDAYDGTILLAIAGLLAKHDAAIEGARLSKLLAKDGTPAMLTGSIRTEAKNSGISTEKAGVRRVEDIYNKKLSEEKQLKP